jgi:hypothetical protein
MNTPISQLVPKFRKKLADCAVGIKPCDDETLANFIKMVIQFGKLDGKTLNTDGSAINPAIADNSKEEQQLILKACLFLLGSQRGTHSSTIGRLEAELYKIENGEDLFSGK